jgi:hypothetical protein
MPACPTFDAIEHHATGQSPSAVYGYGVGLCHDFFLFRNPFLLPPFVPPPVQLASALPRLPPQRRLPISIRWLQFLMKAIKQVAFCAFGYKERLCACKNVQNVQPALKNHGHQ